MGFIEAHGGKTLCAGLGEMALIALWGTAGLPGYFAALGGALAAIPVAIWYWEFWTDALF